MSIKRARSGPSRKACTIAVRLIHSTAGLAASRLALVKAVRVATPRPRPTETHRQSPTTKEDQSLTDDIDRPQASSLVQVARSTTSQRKPYTASRKQRMHSDSRHLDLPNFVDFQNNDRPKSLPPTQTQTRVEIQEADSQNNFKDVNERCSNFAKLNKLHQKQVQIRICVNIKIKDLSISIF